MNTWVEELTPLTPDSVTWSVFGDATFLLGAGHRLLMDVAHPVVAAGVRDYSVFRSDPYGRARRTLEMIMGVVYGRAEAMTTASRLRALHRGFTGQFADGSRWSALNPEAFHWVHASLVHGIWVQRQELGRGWRPGEVEQFYQEMRQVGRMYGVRDKDMPGDWASFVAWFEDMIAHRLQRNDITDQVVRLVAAPTPPPLPVLGHAWVWNRSVRPVAGHINAVITAGLLSPQARELFGVDWDADRQRSFDRIAMSVRATLPKLPPRLRMVPPAYRAIKAARR